MSEGDYTIRRGTRADEEQLVDLHYRVFHLSTHHLLVLGRPFLTQAYRWYCESPKAFTLIAEGEHGIAGCTAANEGSYYAVFRENWGQLVKTLIFKPTLCFHPLVLRRLRTLFPPSVHGHVRTKPGKRGYVAYLALDPSARGRGIGAALIRATLEMGGAMGWNEVVGRLHRDNVPARFLYKTLHFENCPELDSGDLVGVRVGISQQSK